MGLSRHFEVLANSMRDSHGHAKQRMSFERMVETHHTATERLASAMIDIRRDTGASLKIGKPKELGRAEDKIKDDYKGDASLLCDMARGKIIVDSPEQIQTMQENLPDLLAMHGMFVVQESDYFKTPKAQTGYSCLNFKIAVPVGEDDKGQAEYQICELQVVAEQIEAVSKQSHFFKRKSEDITAEGLVSPADQMLAWAYSTIARGITAQVRHAHGYEALLDNPAKHRLTEQRQKRYQDCRNMLYDVLAEQANAETHSRDAELFVEREQDKGKYFYAIKHGTHGAEFMRYTQEENIRQASLQRYSEADAKWVPAGAVGQLAYSSKFEIFDSHKDFAMARTEYISDARPEATSDLIRESIRRLEEADLG